MLGHDGLDVAIQRQTLGLGFGGELGFEFGLEVEMDQGEERIALPVLDQRAYLGGNSP